jgi:hypothetical protein
MSDSKEHYVSDPGPPWSVPSQFDTLFDWDYGNRRAKLLTLYDKGKKKQWDADTRLDWSIDVDPEDPRTVPDAYVAIYGSPWWEKMSDKQRAQVRHHTSAWTNSQFLHGEQGALICAAKIVQCVPDADSKFYAATQVMDEARHVEVFDRYLRTKMKMAYPINQELKHLLEDVVRDSRWDFTYLGMQIMIEGLALAGFGLVRDWATEPLFASLNAYVMQDEARHGAFGVQALGGLYDDMSEAERNEREDFVVQCSYLMRDRLLAPEVWDYFDLPKKEVLEWVSRSAPMKMFRKLLFSRIVPNVKAIGLWGPRVQRAFEELGVIRFANMSPDDAFQADEAAATQLDAYIAEGFTVDESMQKAWLTPLRAPSQWVPKWLKTLGEPLCRAGQPLLYSGRNDRSGGQMLRSLVVLPAALVIGTTPLLHWLRPTRIRR